MFSKQTTLPAFRLTETGAGAGFPVRHRLQNGSYRISFVGNGMTDVHFFDNGDMKLAGELTTGGGTCGGGCDKVFDADYDLPSIEEHAEAMYAQGYLPNVGPTPEGAPINVSDKLGRMLNELEKAHIYIAEINAEKTRLQSELNAERQFTRTLESRLSSIEAIIAE